MVRRGSTGWLANAFMEKRLNANDMMVCTYLIRVMCSNTEAQRALVASPSMQRQTEMMLTALMELLIANPSDNNTPELKSNLDNPPTPFSKISPPIVMVVVVMRMSITIHTLQYIQYNIYNTIQYNTIQYNTPSVFDDPSMAPKLTVRFAAGQFGSAGDAAHTVERSSSKAARGCEQLPRALPDAAAAPVLAFEQGAGQPAQGEAPEAITSSRAAAGVSAPSI